MGSEEVTFSGPIEVTTEKSLGMARSVRCWCALASQPLGGGCAGEEEAQPPAARRRRPTLQRRIPAPKLRTLLHCGGKEGA